MDAACGRWELAFCPWFGVVDDINSLRPASLDQKRQQMRGRKEQLLDAECRNEVVSKNPTFTQIHMARLIARFGGGTASTRLIDFL